MAPTLTSFFIVALFAGAATAKTQYVLMLNSPNVNDPPTYARLTCMMFSDDAEVQQEYEAQQLQNKPVFKVSVEYQDFLKEDFGSYKVVGIAGWQDATEADDKVFEHVQLTRSLQVSYRNRAFKTEAAVAVIEVAQDRQYRPTRMLTDRGSKILYIIFKKYVKHDTQTEFTTAPLLKTKSPVIKVVATCRQVVAKSEMVRNGLDKYLDTSESRVEADFAKKYGLGDLSACGDLDATEVYAVQDKLPLPLVQYWSFESTLSFGSSVGAAVGTRNSKLDVYVYLRYDGITLERRLVQVGNAGRGEPKVEFESPCEVADYAMTLGGAFEGQDGSVAAINLDLTCGVEKVALNEKPWDKSSEQKNDYPEQRGLKQKLNI